MKKYINKEYIITMINQLRRCNKNNKVYIIKKDGRDIIFITLKEIEEEKKIDITRAVIDYSNRKCNLKELQEYIWNRYQAWEYKNTPPYAEKELIGLKKEVAKEYPEFEQMLENIGITWTGFKKRLTKGMTYQEALTTPKIQPGYGMRKRNK